MDREEKETCVSYGPLASYLSHFICVALMTILQIRTLWFFKRLNEFASYDAVRIWAQDCFFQNSFLLLECAAACSLKWLNCNDQLDYETRSGKVVVVFWPTYFEQCYLLLFILSRYFIQSRHVWGTSYLAGQCRCIHLQQRQVSFWTGGGWV